MGTPMIIGIKGRTQQAKNNYSILYLEYFPETLDINYGTNHTSVDVFYNKPLTVITGVKATTAKFETIINDFGRIIGPTRNIKTVAEIVNYIQEWFGSKPARAGSGNLGLSPLLRFIGIEELPGFYFIKSLGVNIMMRDALIKEAESFQTPIRARVNFEVEEYIGSPL